MTHRDHIRLIQSAITKSSSIWADLGSGEGAFTLALADLLPIGSKIYSIDKDPQRLFSQRKIVGSYFPTVNIEYIIIDFTEELALPKLDGILMANSLHFVENQIPLLAKLKTYLKPAGKLLLVEYNVDVGNYWIPYPFSFATFIKMVEMAGYSQPKLLDTIPSEFLHEIYSAVCINE